MFLRLYYKCVGFSGSQIFFSRMARYEKDIFNVDIFFVTVSQSFSASQIILIFFSHFILCIVLISYS